MHGNGSSSMEVKAMLEVTVGIVKHHKGAATCTGQFCPNGGHQLLDFGDRLLGVGNIER